MTRRKIGSLAELIARARKTLGMTQAELGPALGWSHKTALRWEWGRSSPDGPAMEKLLSLIAPVDVELAAELAAAAGMALPAPAPPTPVPAELPAKPALPEVTLDDRAELVVHAAAEATELPPAAVRPLLFAAVARAVALGLTTEQLAASLRLRVAMPDSARGARVAGVRVATKPVTTDEAEADSPSPRRARAH
jgi:DNA-binding XRE family transcriptional regulator